MKAPEKRLSNKQDSVIISLCCIALAIVMVVIASLAWINFAGGSSKPTSFTVGKVDYQIPVTGSDLFYSEFYEAFNDYEETPDIDEYVHATSVAIGEKGSSTPITQYDLQQDTMGRLGAITNVVNCTDTMQWASSNTNNVTVSNYGTIRAVGTVGSSAVITLTVTNNEPESPNYRQALTATVTVTVTHRQVEEGQETYYADLPAGRNILRQAFWANNYSIVPTKLRMKMMWTYTSITEEDTTDNATDYTIADIITAAQTQSGTTVTPTTLTIADQQSPFSLVFTTANTWNRITPDGTLLFTTSDSVTWSATKLRLTQAQYTALVSHLAGTNPGFVLTASMVNEAYTYYCYGVATGTDGDYGTEIPAIAVAGTPDPIAILDQIVITNSYSAYSSKRLFTVSITLQARQSEKYMMNTTVNDPWFDVACITGNEA